MSYLRLPLVVVFFAYLGGLLPGLRFGGPGELFGAAAVVVVAAGFTGLPRGLPTLPGWRSGCLLVAFILLGLSAGAHRRHSAAADCRLAIRDGARVEFEGALAATSLPPAAGARAPLFPLAVERVVAGGKEMQPCTGTVRVRLPAASGRLPAGTQIRVAGHWSRMAAERAGGWPRDGAFAGMLAGREVRTVQRASWSRHPLLTIRGHLEGRIHVLFPRHAALADALLLGRRETLDREVSERFARSGLVHLLAISGTHVALLATVFLLLATAFRAPRRSAIWFTLLAMSLYLMVIGAPPSAVRSGVMVGLVLVSRLLQRPCAALPIAAAAALVILVADPLVALDAGFQLSFAGVLGILLLRGPAMARLPAAWRRGWRRPLCESMIVSIAAFVATAPVVAYHFGQIAPVAILANLPAIPLTSFALVGVGAAVAVDPLAPALARLLADGAGAGFDLLGVVVDHAARLPGGHAPVSQPNWGMWGVAALILLVAFDLARPLRVQVRWIVAVGSTGGLLLVLPVAAGALDAGVEIAFIDVGQGDAIALRTPRGRWLLVDAGPRDESYDAGEKRVLPFLRSRGVRRLEALVLSHPHMDHIGGAAAVMNGMEVGAVVEPGLPFGTEMYVETLRVAQEEGVRWTPARAGRTLEVDGVDIEFLWPLPQTLDSPEDANEISAVVLIRYGAFSALLTGDASEEVERRLVAEHGARLQADVLKAGHHGSRTSTSAALLDRVRPALVVVSSGRRNRYGHPARETLDRLAVRQVPVARTDTEGTVTIDVDAGGETWRRVD